jgi:Flp pilus assembly protein TadB
MVLAAGISVNGIHGFFFLLAAILFLIAAIVAWFVPPRAHWATAVSAGLLLWVLTNLVH